MLEEDLLLNSACKGFFRGKVVRHLNKGKLKVFIPGVYPAECELNPDMLPDCEQATPLFGGTCNGNGMFSYPDLGTIVWCFFLNEDLNYPVAFAATLGGPSAKNQYQETRPDVSKSNIESGKDAYIHKINSGLSYIKIWESGRIELIVKGDEAGKDYCNIEMDGKGNLTLATSLQILLNTLTLKVNAGTQIEIVTPTYSNTNSVSNNTVAPSINIDAKSASGMVCIKGNSESQMFV